MGTTSQTNGKDKDRDYDPLEYVDSIIILCEQCREEYNIFDMENQGECFICEDCHEETEKLERKSYEV